MKVYVCVHHWVYENSYVCLVTASGEKAREWLGDSRDGEHDWHAVEVWDPVTGQDLGEDEYCVRPARV